jgi:hypothetical protein
MFEYSKTNSLLTSFFLSKEGVLCWAFNCVSQSVSTGCYLLGVTVHQASCLEHETPIDSCYIC